MQEVTVKCRTRQQAGNTLVQDEKFIITAKEKKRETESTRYQQLILEQTHFVVRESRVPTRSYQHYLAAIVT